MHTVRNRLYLGPAGHRRKKKLTSTLTCHIVQRLMCAEVIVFIDRGLRLSSCLNTRLSPRTADLSCLFRSLSGYNSEHIRFKSLTCIYI